MDLQAIHMDHLTVDLELLVEITDHPLPFQVVRMEDHLRHYRIFTITIQELMMGHLLHCPIHLPFQ